MCNLDSVDQQTHFGKGREKLWKDMLFGERVGRGSHSVTDGCQNEVRHGSVEGISHQCEISQKGTEQKATFQRHVAASGIVRVNLLPGAAGTFHSPQAHNRQIPEVPIIITDAGGLM